MEFEFPTAWGPHQGLGDLEDRRYIGSVGETDLLTGHSLISPTGAEMRIMEDIKRAVCTLPAADLREFRRWFLEFDAELWDKQFEDDVAAGKLDHLVEER